MSTKPRSGSYGEIVQKSVGHNPDLQALALARKSRAMAKRKKVPIGIRRLALHEAGYCNEPNLPDDLSTCMTETGVGLGSSRAMAAVNAAESPHGRVAEWSNAPVLKTGVPQGTGGSNPSPTAGDLRDGLRRCRVFESAGTVRVSSSGTTAGPRGT